MPTVAYMNGYFSASWIPASSVGGPSPFPMATIVCTPASRARAITCSRSMSNCLPSRCACESTNMLMSLGADGRIRPSRFALPLRSASRQLLQPRSNRYILQKACQYWLPAFQRCRDNHSIRLQPAQFSRSEVGDDHHLAAHKSFRRVRFCDASQNLSHFRADIDFQSQQFIGFGHALGNLHHADAQLDFGEIVDSNLSPVDCRRRRSWRDRLHLRRTLRHGGRLCYLLRFFECGPSLLFFHLLHPFDRAFVCPRKNRPHVAEFRPQSQLSPRKSGQVEFLNVTEPHLLPDFCGRFGHDGMRQSRRNPQRLRRGVKNRRKPGSALVVLLFSQ